MDTVRTAVVGLGGWGTNVVRAAANANHHQLTTICDSNESTLAKFSRLYPQTRTCQDYDSILQSKDIDAIFLVTPAVLHFSMAMAALDSGKHVYVEKPLTLTTKDAEQLLAKARQTKQILMVGHLLEYHPAVALLKRWIDQGELGDILYFYSKRLNLGVVRRDENCLWSLAPHDISMILYLLGCEPESVSATGLSLLQPEIEDVVFVSLMFPGKRMAQIHVSWLDPHKERKLVIVGSKKMAVFDDMHPNEKIRIYDKGAMVKWTSPNIIQAISVRHGDIQIPVVPNEEPLSIEIQHFIDCVRTRSVPRSGGEDGLRVVRVLEGASQSLKKNGIPISLSGEIS